MGTSKEGVEASAAQRYIFLVAGIASFVLAVISPSLPHTPPKPATGGDALATIKAARLLKHPFVAVLFLVTFIDAAVHQSFFYWTASFLKTDVGIPANWVPPVMKIGQIAEILTMLVLGYVLKSLGWRTTMIFGVLGHAARFAVFAFYPEPWAAVTVNVLHGICYAFFFATVYIFVDEFFPKDVRSQRSGALQRADPGIWSVRRELDLRATGGDLQDRGQVELPRDLPVLHVRRADRRGHPGSVLPPTEGQCEGTADRYAGGGGAAGGVRSSVAKARRVVTM